MAKPILQPIATASCRDAAAALRRAMPPAGPQAASHATRSEAPPTLSAAVCRIFANLVWLR